MEFSVPLDARHLVLSRTVEGQKLIELLANDVLLFYISSLTSLQGPRGNTVVIENGQQGPKGDEGAKGSRGLRGEPGPEGMTITDAENHGKVVTTSFKFYIQRFPTSVYFLRMIAVSLAISVFGIQALATKMMKSSLMNIHTVNSPDLQ